MKIKQFKSYIILIISIVYLVSCSDTPSMQQYQDAIQQHAVKQDYKSIYSVRNVKKLNGYALEEFYYAEMEFDRIFMVNIDDAIVILKQDAKKQNKGNILDDFANSVFEFALDSGYIKNRLIEQYGEFEQGDVITGNITLKFLKTEQGWRFYPKDKN